MKIPDSIEPSYLILKHRHGPRLNWGFNSGLRITVSFGVLGAVGLLLVIKAKRYLEFNIPDKDVASPNLWVIPGLENLGNNCFLNVVLQALASCSGFRKYLWELMEEYGSLPLEEGDENVPLVNALTSLVEELCTIHHRRTVLSPRKLMLAMDHHIPSFSLAKQQDAEEALSHLLSLLREEISEHFVPNKSCLAELETLPNVRILSAKSSEGESEWQRWSRSLLKPFDGIIGSILICKSCSFQISLDFQLSHSLHLSPPATSGGTIIAGCTLGDCLNRFFAAEHVEHYCCSNCWHKAAVEYVSAFSKDKRDIEKLESCNRNDNCECKTLSSLETFPWSNRFSCTFKQLSIARSPKIICIHLQRASYNVFGQLVKLRGHISFPLMLDLSRYMHTEVGIKNTGNNPQFGPLNQSSQEIRFFPYTKYQAGFKPSTVKTVSSETEQERNAIAVEDGPRLEPSDEDVVVLSAPSRHQMYRLVSVVEHFGTSGSGHYTVYRKVTGKIGDEDSVALLESAIDQWFCVSDSEVHTVSEKDALDANASMLFYEKIENS